jgi:predicted ATPase
MARCHKQADQNRQVQKENHGETMIHIFHETLVTK